MKKLIMSILILVLALTGCSANSMNSLYDNDEEIASENNSFNLNEEEQTINVQQLKGNVEFEGMDTIWTYEADEDVDIDITYLLKVSNGKAKLVLISPDNNTTLIVESTNESELKDYATNTLQIKKGINRIKLVAGKNTISEFDISIPNGRFEELGM